MSYTTVSSRIPDKLHGKIEAATEAEGTFRSELIRRALRYYIEENPDGIAALGQMHRHQSPETLSRSSPRARQPSDVMEDLGLNTDS